MRRRVVVAVLACLLANSQASGASQKLFLKDGTYQLVSSYEVQGDRVRYYSVERSEWEEVPASLVDFEATKRAEQEIKAGQKKALEEARELAKERFDRPAESGFEIAPGVHLPQEEGAYAYDGTRVIRLIQSYAETAADKRRAALVLAMPAPLLKSRSRLILTGAKAAVRLQQAQPTFYVQSADGLGAKLEVIVLKVVKESRVVEEVEAGKGGEVKPVELHVAVPLERAQLAPGLYRLTLLHPLDAGEYALIEPPGRESQQRLWDFGVFEKPTTTPQRASTHPNAE